MNTILALAAALVVSQTPQFQRHDIADFEAGYQASVADVNNDGRPDVLALSIAKPVVEWFENPQWQRHPIADTALNIDMAPRDIDGDGQVELVLASGFYFDDASRGGDLEWLRPDADSSKPWHRHRIAIDPVVHRVRWGDLDGDGHQELIHAPFFGPGSKGVQSPKPAHLWAFRVPADPETDSWPIWKIDETLTNMHGVYVADIDGDGRAEVLTASREGVHRFDWEGDAATGRWEKEHISPGAPPPENDPNGPSGSSEIAFGTLGPGRPFYAAIEPWHGNQLVVYTPPEDGGFWTRRVLDGSLDQGHGLAVADLDGDGQGEIVFGSRGDKNRGVAIFDPDATGENFARIEVDPTMPADCTIVADINGDGRLDLIVNGGGANKLAWYENVTKEP